MAPLLPKSQSPTYRFLKKTSVNGPEHNLLCLLNGKWNIPDDKYARFLELYAADHDTFAFGLVEKRRQVFPYLLDLDFDKGTEQERRLMVHAILHVLHD